MCGISPSTQGRAFPHNKAALFFHLFCLWSSIPGKNISSAKLELRLSRASLKGINGWWELTQSLCLPSWASSVPGSVLSWPELLELRETLWHTCRGPGICVFILAHDFTLPAKREANISVPFATAILYFSSWSISVLQTNMMEAVEYSNTGLAECPVMCPLCVLRGVTAEHSQHLTRSEFIWTVSLCKGGQN